MSRPSIELQHPFIVPGGKHYLVREYTVTTPSVAINLNAKRILQSPVQ